MEDDGKMNTVMQVFGASGLYLTLEGVLGNVTIVTVLLKY
jgi:hypothetical protein